MGRKSPSHSITSFITASYFSGSSLWEWSWEWLNGESYNGCIFFQEGNNPQCYYPGKMLNVHQHRRHYIYHNVAVLQVSLMSWFLILTSLSTRKRRFGSEVADHLHQVDSSISSLVGSASRMKPIRKICMADGLAISYKLYSTANVSFTFQRKKSQTGRDASQITLVALSCQDRPFSTLHYYYELHPRRSPGSPGF